MTEAEGQAAAEWAARVAAALSAKGSAAEAALQHVRARTDKPDARASASRIGGNPNYAPGG